LDALTDPTTRRRIVRVGFLLIVSVTGLVVASGYIGSDLTSRYESGDATVAPRENATVVTTSPRPSADASIVAFSPNGSTLYYNETYDYYFDVDPVPGTARTVEYVAVDLVSSNCDLESRVTGGRPCSRNVVERVNLSTGEVTRLFDYKTRPKDIGGWHDADRIGEDRFVVAGSTNDRVFIYNTTTDLIEWQWSVQSAFDTESGGLFPSDWAHLNDVERLPDGRIMVSLRNQDQVVFLDRESGVEDAWTLGTDDDYDTLYEQHNPDYIPADRGGPAVLVADSENSRIVEYQRIDGDWEQTWAWQDGTVQWPRDADRLPNDHTLITDSGGNRVLEVDERGEVVWSVPVDTPYEAERLGTGDESATGRAASAIPDAETRLRSDADATQSGVSVRGRIVGVARAVVPPLLLNGVIFVTPPGFGVFHFVGGGVFVVTLALWAIVEFRWSAYRLRLPVARQ
jgi:hypothetical protein